MNNQSSHERTSHGVLHTWLLAIVFTTTAVAIRYTIEFFIGWTPHTFASIATLAAFGAAWYGGFKAGLLTTLVGSYFFFFCFVEPRYSLIFREANDVLSIVVSGVCGLIGSKLCDSLHDARRRAEAAVEDEKRARTDAESWRLRYEAALKTTRSVLYDCDRRDRQVVYGGDCEAVLGYTASELKGDISKWIALIHPDDRVQFLERLDQASIDFTSFQSEYRMIRKDGGIVWMRDDGYLADQWTSKQPTHAIGFVRDVTEQRKAEQQLRQSEERLNSLLEQLPIGVGIVGLDGKMELQNPIMQHFFAGMSAEVDPERRHRWQAWKSDCSTISPEEWPATRALRGERVVPGVEFLFNEDDGQQVWLNYAASPLRDADGAVIGAIGMIEDIDTRKRIENLLRQSEQINRSLMEGSADCVSVLDMDGRLQMMNRPFVSCAGIDDPGLLYGADWVAIWPRETRDALRLAIETAASGKVYRCDVVSASAGQTPKCWEVTASPVRDYDGGQIERLLVISRDITARHDIENQLRASERRFRAVLEHQFKFSALLTPDARIVLLSTSALRNAGISAEALVGMPFIEAPWFRGLPDVQEIWKEQFAEAVTEFRSSSRREVRFLRPDGSVRWSINTVSAIWNDEKEVEYLVAEGIDITDRKEFEERLRESDRRKDEFLATLAHELRNPLSTIRYAVKIMSLAREDFDAVEKAVGMVDRQAGHMAQLIDDLMDLSRISRGMITLKRARLPVADFLQDAIDLSRPLIDERGHDFALTVPPNPLYVDGDRTRLLQVLGNLLNNAATYTEKGGKIRLTVEPQDDEVVFTVEDTGIGIPADMLNKVFDMFTRVERPPLNTRGGLGIGLNIARRLIEMHDGSIVAESDGLGRGSRFTIRLPLVENLTADSSAAHQVPAVNRHARRRILVVDDDRNVADNLAEMLRIIGHDTQAAYGGAEGIAAAETFQPDLILMDIGMPDLDGYEACRQIREKPWGRRIMIVAHTGWGQESVRQKAEDAAFDCHMVKSANPAVLDGLLEKLELKMTKA